MTTATEARDAIMSLVEAAWTASGAVTETMLLLFDDTPGERPAEDEFGKALPFGRCSVRHNTGRQDTLGARGRRRYLSSGIVTVQVFTARGDGHALGDQIVEVVKAPFRSPTAPAPVWFNDVEVREIGPDGPWFHTNVQATFFYQERA